MAQDRIERRLLIDALVGKRVTVTWGTVKAILDDWDLSNTSYMMLRGMLALHEDGEQFRVVGDGGIAFFSFKDITAVVIEADVDIPKGDEKLYQSMLPLVAVGAPSGTEQWIH